MLTILVSKLKYGHSTFRISALFTFLCLFTTTRIFSQNTNKTTTFQIQGTVYDGSTGKPLIAVTVALLSGSTTDNQKVAITDSSGKFTFNLVEKGNYILKLSDIMYKEEKREVAVMGSNVDIGALFLKSKVTTLQEITVASKKKFIERKIDKVVLNVESSPTATGGSVLDVLQTAPGVSVTDALITLKGRKGPTIMIDGRPSSLSSSDITRILESLPANSVSRIELIANPSAKNDAAGSAGIINIVTKKMRVQGFNSTVNASAGFGVYPKYNGGINMNYRINRLNLFGNYYINDNEGFSRYTSKRVIDALVFDESGRGKSNSTSHNYAAGLDYEINSRNIIGFSVTGNKYDGTFKENFNTDFIQIKKDSSLVVKNLTHSDYHNTSWNLNHEFKIDSSGKVLTTNLDYSRFKSYNNGLFNNTYLDRDGQLLRAVEALRNNSIVSIKIATAKIDYTHPVSRIDMTIQAGLKTSIVKTDSDIRFDKKEGDAWKIDPEKTNHFLFEEYINAAYLNINKKFKVYELQIGLRAEQTNNKGNLVTGNIVNKNDYIKVFPSFFLSRKLDNSQSINLSYGRRINRPSYEDLNPFIYYNSPYSYYQGNPYLKPEFTNTLELGYSLNDELLVSLNYSRTNDYFTYLGYLNDTTRVTRESINNFKHYTSYGTSISLDKELADWWYLSCNVDVFHEAFSSFYRTKNFKSSIVTFNSNLTSEFTLPKNNSFVLTGLYRSPTIDGIKKNLARYRVDVGYRKSWFNKNLILKVAVRDIFYMYRKNGINRIENLNQEFTNRTDTRVLTFDLTYKFGNQKLQSRNRKKGNTDELNRIKGMN